MTTRVVVPACGQWAKSGQTVQQTTLTMKYPKLNLGQMEAMVNKLGGMAGVSHFLSGASSVITTTSLYKKFTTWKTVEIGKYSEEEYYEMLKNVCSGKNSVTAKSLSHIIFLASKHKNVDLALVSNIDLGFNSSTTQKEIYERALSLGLKFCGIEIALALRLQYLDQPKNETIRMAMEYISMSEGEGIFLLSSSADQLDIRLYPHENQDKCYRGDDPTTYAKYVFVIPPKND